MTIIKASEQIFQQANANVNKAVFGNILFNVKAYGAKGNGSTDDTAAINATLAAIKAAPCGVLYFPPGTYAISSTIHLIRGASVHIAVKGAGKWASKIVRMPSFTSGDVFVIDTADGDGTSVLIEDIQIYHGLVNITSGYAVHIKNGASMPVSLNRVWINNGYGGVWLDNTSSVVMNEVFYVQEAPYSALYSSFAGLFISGHCNTNFISNCDFFGQDVNAANNLQYGILIRGCDGVNIVNTAANGKVGVGIEGGYVTNIVGVYFDSCIFDNCSIRCVDITGNNAPNAFKSIRISDSHINLGGATTGGQECVRIGGDSDFVQIADCNINLAQTNGVIVATGTNYLGVAKKSIMIDNNDISENNLSNAANTHGVFLAANSSGVKLIGNSIKNRSTAGHQKFGLAIGATCTNLLIEGNDLTGNETGPIILDIVTPTTSIISNNLGVENVTANVATATTISIPPNTVIGLTGLVNISTINGGWSGRRVVLFANDGTVNLVTGGNILRALAIAQFQSVTLTYVGTNWVVGG